MPDLAYGKARGGLSIRGVVRMLTWHVIRRLILESMFSSCMEWDGNRGILRI